MIRCLAILISLAALPLWGQTPADKATTAGVAEFTAAYQAWDGARFDAAARLFQQAADQTSASVTNYYWLGVAQFHRMLHLQNSPVSATNQQAVKAALDEAVAALSKAVELDGRHAESHALLGTLYGMKINGSLARAAWFGPRVAKHRDKAVTLSPDNARVRYLLGMCQFHTSSKPAAYREALTSLLAAEKLFDAEAQRPPAPMEPRWGRSSCRTFIGRTYELLGQPAKAAEYFRKALEEHPADHLAKAGLGRVTGKK